MQMKLGAAEAGAHRRLMLPSLGVTGAVLIVAGLVMAAMPFLGPLIGLAFDGSETWEWNRNRLVLHVLPGVVGALTGFVLLLAHRRHSRDHRGHPAWLPVVATAAAVVGLWNGVGPWLLELILPASEDSALMFHGIPHFESFSGLHQFVLEAVCHWVPGAVTLAAALAAFTLFVRLPSLADPPR